MANHWAPLRSDRGFSVSGLVCAVAVVLTVTSTGLTGVTLARDMARADADASAVARALLRASARARDEHRFVDVQVAQERLRVSSNGSPAAVVSPVLHLRQGFNFHPLNVPRSGRTATRSIASVSTVTFDAAGRLVRESVEGADLAIYLGKPGAPLATRAVVVSRDGQSADVYRWNGGRWK